MIIQSSIITIVVSTVTKGDKKCWETMRAEKKLREIEKFAHWRERRICVQFQKFRDDLRSPAGRVDDGNERLYRLRIVFLLISNTQLMERGERGEWLEFMFQDQTQLCTILRNHVGRENHYKKVCMDNNSRVHQYLWENVVLKP